MQPIRTREMMSADYPQVMALWSRTDGVGLNESDSETAIAAFIARNPGMSAIAETTEGRVVGAVLCGHDGRRGYLHHLAVATEYRKQGVARALLQHCFDRLRKSGIQKCNIFLFPENEDGKAFWLHNGWSERSLLFLQKKVE